MTNWSHSPLLRARPPLRQRCSVMNRTHEITALALWDPKDRPRRVRGDPPGGDPGETEEEVIWGDPLGGKGPAKSAWLAPSPQTLYCLSSLTSFSTHIPTDKNRLCDCLFTDTCPSSSPPRRCREGTDNVSLVFPLEASPVNL